MRQLQVTVPENFSEEVREVIKDYSSDVSSTEVEKDDFKQVEFTTTVESDDIDELTEELKVLDDLESGKLSIRVLERNL